MFLHYSCSTAEVRVSNPNSSLPNSRSLGHTKADLQPLYKLRNLFYKNSKCSWVKWNEVKASRNVNGVKKIEQGELGNGKLASEMLARRIMKSRLLWAKVHHTTKVYSLSLPTYDGKSRTLSRAGMRRGVGWSRRLRLGRDWVLHHLHLRLLRIRHQGVLRVKWLE